MTVDFRARFEPHASSTQTVEGGPSLVVGKPLLIQGKSVAISVQIIFPEQPATRKRREPLPQGLANPNGSRTHKYQRICHVGMAVADIGIAPVQDSGAPPPAAQHVDRMKIQVEDSWSGRCRRSMFLEPVEADPQLVLVILVD